MNNSRRLLLICFTLCAALPFIAHADQAATDADNTARNVRDRDHAEVTPPDQSTRADDIALTRRIRQAIIAHKSLSVNAHNVKIITVNGHVVLRGPVKTEEEKRIIEELAVTEATAANVDNQLEVKTGN